MTPPQSKPPIFLFCGSRDWRDPDPIRDAVRSLPDGAVVVEGGGPGRHGAPGADRLAHDLAHERGLHVATVQALWDQYGPSAGPRRNAAMALFAPVIRCAFAFPLGESKGTNGMVTLLRRADVRVRVWEDGRFVEEPVQIRLPTA